MPLRISFAGLTLARNYFEKKSLKGITHEEMGFLVVTPRLPPGNLIMTPAEVDATQL